MENKKKVHIAACVVTYNQERYIRQCIESILQQKTDYILDIVVGNDASMDNTAEVLNQLQAQNPGRLIVFNRSHNIGLVANTIDLFWYILAHDYAYTAMIDGDDYWCDQEKIQRQVELMEQNQDVAFCYMRTTSDAKMAVAPKQDNPQIVIREMFNDIRHTGIGNGTVLHRNTFLRNVPFEKILAQHLLSMDYTTNVYMAQQGKVAYIDRVSLYWRRTGNTVSMSADKEKAFRYIDHEVRQGLFLAGEFPNTTYAFSREEAERFRQWQMYQWGLSKRNYDVVRECLQSDCFPIQWLSSAPEKKYLGNKCMFNIYIYIIKKMKTIWGIMKKKICRRVGK